jgi:hypothetical protein
MDQDRRQFFGGAAGLAVKAVRRAYRSPLTLPSASFSRGNLL